MIAAIAVVTAIWTLALTLTFIHFFLLNATSFDRFVQRMTLNISDYM